MALNTSHNPSGEGVLIYNGEMILLYIKEVHLKFESSPEACFKGSKKGKLYLTSHRIIFTNKDYKSGFKSFCMPFHCLRDVNLEQPIFGANYLKGTCLAQPGGNWEGSTVFNLSFNQGGCIDFGKALLKATELAGRFQNMHAPPAYAPPAGGFFSPPPAYYMASDNYNGFQAPRNVFPDQPSPNQVYMFEAPPPYTGIGPQPQPQPVYGAPQGFNSPPAPYPAGYAGQIPQQPPYPVNDPPYPTNQPPYPTNSGPGLENGHDLTVPPPSYQDATKAN